MRNMCRFFLTWALAAMVGLVAPRDAQADVYDGEQIVVLVSADTKPLDARELLGRPEYRV